MDVVIWVIDCVFYKELDVFIVYGDIFDGWNLNMIRYLLINLIIDIIMGILNKFMDMVC